MCKLTCAPFGRKHERGSRRGTSSPASKNTTSSCSSTEPLTSFYIVLSTASLSTIPARKT
eukprot:296049-Pleurochrysis_carterae.AAC.1